MQSAVRVSRLARIGQHVSQVLRCAARAAVDPHPLQSQGVISGITSMGRRLHLLLARSAVRVYRLVPIAQHVSQLLRWATVGANRPNPMQSGPQLGHVDDPVAVRVLAMGGTVIFMPSSPVCIVWYG